MYTSFGTLSKKVLNPEVENWREEINGEYVPTVTLYSIEADTLAIILDGIKAAAKKADSLEQMAALASVGAEIEKSYAEAEKEAIKRNVEAEKKFKEWEAAQVAETATEATEAAE